MSLTLLHAETWYCPGPQALHWLHTVSSALPSLHCLLLYHPWLHAVHAAQMVSVAKLHRCVLNSPFLHTVQLLHVGPLVALHPDEAYWNSQSHIPGQTAQRVGRVSVQFAWIYIPFPQSMLHGMHVKS